MFSLCHFRWIKRRLRCCSQLGWRHCLESLNSSIAAHMKPPEENEEVVEEIEAAEEDSENKTILLNCLLTTLLHSLLILLEFRQFFNHTWSIEYQHQRFRHFAVTLLSFELANTFSQNFTLLRKTLRSFV